VPGWWAGRGGAPGGPWAPDGACGPTGTCGPRGGSAEPGARASRGRSSRPCGEYTVVGFSTWSRRERGPVSRADCPAPPEGEPTRRGSRSRSSETASRSWWAAWLRGFAACADRRARRGVPPLAKANATRTTRPAAARPRPTGRPMVAICPVGCLLVRRLVMPAPARNAPSMTSTAPATATGVTSRTLAVAGSERTDQRSHRGYRPASHMSRSAPDDLPCPSGDTLLQ
jgi:hypothetical protein